ncbi:hypothetical protein [Sphingomonas quercus]|nr:hypothetical protein [Sphingomonas quercus]
MSMGLLSAAAAHADDPNDPTMRSDEAHARDRAITKHMNERQLAFVRQRDARSDEQLRSGQESYSAARADYARRMAAWRHAVAACEAGHREYCDN